MTPTAGSLVEAGTPLPAGLVEIGHQNASRLRRLAEFHEASAAGLAWSLDGETLAVATVSGIALYDVRGNARLRFLEAGQRVVDLAFSPDGRWLISAVRRGSERQGYAGDLVLWRGPEWRSLGVLYGTPRALSSLGFTPNGQTLLAAFTSLVEAENSVDFWSTRTWEITGTLHTGPVLEVAISPDGRWLASMPNRYAARLWELDKLTLVHTLHTSFTGAINSLVFSPDGGALATGHYDGAIRLWDAARGELLRTFQTQGVVECLAFSPDGRLLATGESFDAPLVRLWAADTGELLHTLEGHTHGVEELAFSPQGDLLVSASYDGQVLVWGLPP